jgi:hypothetical protein
VLFDALSAEQQRQGKPLEQLTIDLLAQSLGVVLPSHSNGLKQFAGGWTEQELEEFEAATACTEQIDAELWK